MPNVKDVLIEPGFEVWVKWVVLQVEVCCFLEGAPNLCPDGGWFVVADPS